MMEMVLAQGGTTVVDDIHGLHWYAKGMAKHHTYPSMLQVTPSTKLHSSSPSLFFDAIEDKIISQKNEMIATNITLNEINKQFLCFEKRMLCPGHATLSDRQPNAVCTYIYVHSTYYIP